MMCKIFLVALVCVAAAQADESGLDIEIKRAIYRLEGRARNAQERVAGAINMVANKRDVLALKANIFLEKESKMEEQMAQNIQRTADIMEQKAQEENKPPTTFECISKAEEQALNKIEAFGPKFEVDIRRMEITKAASIEVAAKPLQTIELSLDEKLQKFTSEINSCKTSTAIRKVLTRAMREYDYIFSEVRRVEERVSLALNQFIRDANNLFRNIERQARRVQSEGLGAIRRCMTLRDACEEEKQDEEQQEEEQQ